jgi:putative transposase
MSYDPFHHHRRSIRLKGFDYTQPGAYFVTINTHRRLSLFGEITEGVVRLNAFGEIANTEWLQTASIRREITLDEFIVMPDHFHGIVIIMECDGGSAVAHGRDENAALYGDVRARRRRAPTRMDGGAPTRAYGRDESAVLYGDVRARRRRAPTPVEQFGKPISGSIPTIIRAYKSAVTARINELRGTPGAPVWQRNYYEHIIRDMDELSRIREYIRNNPAAWETDYET